MLLYAVKCVYDLPGLKVKSWRTTKKKVYTVYSIFR